jgi:histidyl-tRNA synthetase
MALPTQPYKGARDFYPEDKRLQKYIFSKLRQVVERYGYEEYDAPILESLDLYRAKSGEEIVNEQTYTFEDRGGRQVVIRPEMTPTVSRMVAAKRQELGYPLRWYSIPNLWRYERPQKGRLREHWQLNVDLFGVESSAAEEELIHVTDSIMRRLGATHDMYKIRLNDRRFIDHLLHSYLGFDEVQSQSLSKLIDRMHKMEPAEFQTKLDALCTPSQRDDGTVERLLAVLSTDKLETLPPELVEHESLSDLKALLTKLADANIANVVFDPSLMRGFDYYNGIVFEVFDVSPDNNRSLFGGGRYDGLVGLFGVEPVPTVGFGMGDVVLADFLETHGLLPKLLPETHVYAVVTDQALLDQAQKVVTELRKDGVNVALDISGKSLDKQFKTADKKGVPYVLVIGQKELDEGQFKLRDMRSGTEEMHGIDRITSIVEDQRTSSNDRD